MTRHRSKAFTLIELIIAIVVISIAVPPVMLAFKESHGRRVDSVNASKARWLALEKMDDITADRHSSTRGYSYLVNSNYAAESPVSGFTGFTRSVSITESGVNLVAGSGSGYKTIVVSVTYLDGRGVAKTMSVTTVATDYTP